MLGADEDGRMLCLHSELLVYIFKCKWTTETVQFLHKFLTLFNLITRITVAT